MDDPIIVVRTAKPEDQDVLSALIAAAYARLDNGQYDRAQLSAALPAMSKANPRLLRSGTYYVIEVDGVAAACGGWSFEQPGSTMTEDGVAHIRHFATHPDFLRRGLARSLLDRCLEEARAKGARIMKSQATLPAEKFYESAGFRTRCTFNVEMGPGLELPVLDMEKALA
ncbi:MAG: GNAT family N-acetyltransferase [Rhizobiaceae bacterium]|nr:GNAT family N-acetyltransferase [Rhizobiaceae bacterium]